MNSIMVLVEHRQGAVRDVTFEMMSAARALGSECGSKVEAVLLGHGSDDALSQLREQAENIVFVSHPNLKDFNYEAYQPALVKLCTERKPALLMVAHSGFGTDLGPSLAVALGWPLVSDVTGFRPVTGGFVMSRGMYSGKLCADWRAPAPAVAMVRQSSFRSGPAEFKAETELWDPGQFPEPRTRFIRLEELPTTGVDIAKADVIVGIGRGVREEKNIAPIREFAESIGAVLAGSRPVIDAGWLPKEVQVGSSGKTVKPKVYIALGISGAFQHIAGMKGADTIIAVNKDPNAPIFSVAHFGIVDDLHKVVPLLASRLREARS
uniref:Electron transfer flavoprotein subunit alpha/FixB family protein n=1 Tax=candidate division WOR-3 bacterium TaxID=2052148 RepID=A0A7C4CC69_UNCW3